MTRFRKRAALAVLAIASVATACTDTTTNSGATTDSGATTSSTDAGSTTSAATTSEPVTTVVSSTTPATTSGGATTAPGPSTTPASACEGAGGIAPGADIGTVIHGDVDGDLADDTITEYSLDGVPHVHALLATGGHSDAEVPIGFADHVDISFENFDYSIGAQTPPPLVVLATGATKAGTAQFTFLTLTTDYCILAWHIAGGAMFVGRLSAEGPYEGLSCETAAGSRYYALNEAEQAAPGGDWTITQTVIHHNFTLVELEAPLPTFTMPDGPAVQPLFGDFSSCDHPPLFS